jgi:hypothetical protein
MYRWTVKEEDEAEFVRTWEEGTLKIQASCEGAMGSILLRSSENPQTFFWNGTLAEQRNMGGGATNYADSAISGTEARIRTLLR